MDWADYGMVVIEKLTRLTAELKGKCKECPVRLCFSVGACKDNCKVKLVPRDVLG